MVALLKKHRKVSRGTPGRRARFGLPKRLAPFRTRRERRTLFRNRLALSGEIDGRRNCRAAFAKRPSFAYRFSRHRI